MEHLVTKGIHELFRMGFSTEKIQKILSVDEETVSYQISQKSSHDLTIHKHIMLVMERYFDLARKYQKNDYEEYLFESLIGFLFTEKVLLVVQSFKYQELYIGKTFIEGFSQEQSGYLKFFKKLVSRDISSFQDAQIFNDTERAEVDSMEYSSYLTHEFEHIKDNHSFFKEASFDSTHGHPIVQLARLRLRNISDSSYSRLRPEIFINAVDHWIGLLPNKEAFIIRKSFGLKEEPMQLEDIGNAWKNKMTSDQVSKLRSALVTRARSGDLMRSFGIFDNGEAGKIVSTANQHRRNVAVGYYHLANLLKSKEIPFEVPYEHQPRILIVEDFTIPIKAANAAIASKIKYVQEFVLEKISEIKKNHIFKGVNLDTTAKYLWKKYGLRFVSES